MQRLRRIADEDSSGRHSRCRARQLQWIGHAPAGTGELSRSPPKADLQLAQEFIVGERRQGLCALGLRRPDHTIAAVVQRQHCEGARWRKALVGRSVLGPIGPDVGHDRNLVVILDVGIDSGRRTHTGMSPVGRHDEACRPPFSGTGAQGELHASRREMHAFRPRRHSQGH